MSAKQPRAVYKSEYAVFNKFVFFSSTGDSKSSQSKPFKSTACKAKPVHSKPSQSQLSTTCKSKPVQTKLSHSKKSRTTQANPNFQSKQSKLNNSRSKHAQAKLPQSLPSKCTSTIRNGRPQRIYTPSLSALEAAQNNPTDSSAIEG